MSRFLSKRIAVVFAAIVFSLATVAFAAAPCAKLTVSVNPTIAAPGSQVVVTGSVNNCSSGNEKVKVKYEAVGPCGYTDMGTYSLTLKPGETRTASLSYTVPACPGDYTLTATALSGSTVLATSSTTLTVQ